MNQKTTIQLRFTGASKGSDMGSSASMSALVTGANKGIGQEIAHLFARAGLRVIVGARNPERGAKAARTLENDGIVTRYLHLGLTYPASAQLSSADIGGHEGALNILVNNVGVSDPRGCSPENTDLDAVRHIFVTNFFGTLAVIQTMLSLLQKARPAQIINLSSGLVSLSSNSDPGLEHAAYKLIGYGAPKAAVSMLTVQLAAELRDTGIRVNSAGPGFTATDLNAHQRRQTIPHGAPEAVRRAPHESDGATGGFFATDGRRPWVAAVTSWRRGQA